MSTYHDERFPIPTPGRIVRELRLRRPPWWMLIALIAVVIATWIPLAMIYRTRQTKSRKPRIHFFHDMDHQAKFRPQSAHPWFRDGRAMRLPVEGTIARGSLTHDQHFSLGYLTSDGTESGTVTQFVSSLPPQLADQGETLVAHGKQRFDIYCAVCHGPQGAGDGPVNQRAIELKEAKWVPATNLLTQMIRDRADGQIFQAISAGVRSMPSYGSQIPPRDRWSIVTYVRQLQRTQPVAPEPTPPKVASPPGLTETGPTIATAENSSDSP